MVPMTFIWWIYHFWARFWPYFNFVDFRAYFGPFSLVNRDRQKMADLLMKMASNQKMQENKPTLKFNFTIEKRWPVSKFSFWHSHWALVDTGPYFRGNHGSRVWNSRFPQESCFLSIYSIHPVNDTFFCHWPQSMTLFGRFGHKFLSLTAVNDRCP